jgi:hypothetical protein
MPGKGLVRGKLLVPAATAYERLKLALRGVVPLVREDDKARDANLLVPDAVGSPAEHPIRLLYPRAVRVGHIRSIHPEEVAGKLRRPR